METFLNMLIWASSFCSKWPRVAPRALDHQEIIEEGDPRLEEGESSSRDLEEAEHPNPRADVCVPDIFLSHSGSQKPFVESLYKALQSTNHTVFFDEHSLPKGQPFPEKIKEAARGCKVGVVVLSEEFLTSKWPMIELEILISRRGPNNFVLPLFYKLDLEDLKSPKKLAKWRNVWKKMGRENDATQWEQAVNDLRKFNGEVFKEGTRTDVYIDRVVKHICTLIPCYVPYDCSSTQGQSRLAEEIARKFEHLDASQARMVGLHGVGGSGKTTLCKVMVNYYSRRYLGKSFLIEFPFHGGDKSTIISGCKKALRIFTNASYMHLLDKADDFDQVVQLMRDRIGNQDVFLAIDNVWESSLDEARKVLWVGFSANSKILVTSRSEGILKDLLMVTHTGRDNNTSVAPLPAPEREEAFQIFQESFASYNLSVLMDRNEMDHVLERCKFSGSYHALALKALAKYAKRIYMVVDQEEVKHHLARVLQEISSKDLSDVEHVIRLSYDYLQKEKKDLFLEIAVFLLYFPYKGKEYAVAEEWISSLLPKFRKIEDTRLLINELFLDGLIQIEVDEDGRKNLRLHDLYCELALREIASSPRFLITGITEISVEEVKCEKLETVVLQYDKSGQCPFFEKLQQCKCPKLKVLKALLENSKSKVWLDSMPSLTVLDLTVSKLGLVRWGLVGNEAMEEVGGLSGTLKDVCITECGALKRMPDMSSLPCLERLELVWNAAMEEVGGLSRTLKDVRVKHCGALKGMPSMSSLTCLERLELVGNEAMEEVGGLSRTLKDVRVTDCRALKRMPSMSSLTCLERLKLVGNAAMEEVGGKYLSSTLQHLDITDCGILRSYPSLDECMHLESLETGCAHHVRSLQKLANLLTRLRYCSIKGESTVKEIDVGGLTNLEDLNVERCGRLKKLKVGGLGLKTLSVWQCDALEEITGDSNVLPSLEYLGLVWCASLKKVGVISSTRLQQLHVIDCGSLQKSSFPEAILPAHGKYFFLSF